MTQPRRCSIAAALGVIGEKWSLLVVRELFLGVHRFSDIAANTGAPRDVLTARLRALTERGIVERRAYSEHPPRFEYHLTPVGRDLRPIVMALKQWGDDHAIDGDPPLMWEHTCGHEFRMAVHCEACGEELRRGSLTAI